jgi:3-oxoacyl-[acyl-carrier-protein] synthase-3
MDIFDISKKPIVSQKFLDEGGQYPKMKGREVFKVAVTKIPEVIQEALNANNLKVEDVDLFLPHQANLRINQFAAQQLGIPEGKFYNNIQQYGNTTAASIPLLLYDVLENGMLKEGNIVVLVGFGSGFTWGASVLRW